MKFTIPHLKPGDFIRAEVVEVLTGQEFIVSFGGDLVRVKNGSRTSFQKGMSVLLEVTQVHPLSFKLAGPPSSHLDRRI